jgi:hypothetical protein
MGHHIQAFISREELLREITQHYPTAWRRASIKMCRFHFAERTRKLMMIPVMSDRLSLQEPPAAMILPSLMRRGQDRSALSKFMRFQASGDAVGYLRQNAR